MSVDRLNGTESRGHNKKILNNTTTRHVTEQQNFLQNKPMINGLVLADDSLGQFKLSELSCVLQDQWVCLPVCPARVWEDIDAVPKGVPMAPAGAGRARCEHV